MIPQRVDIQEVTDIDVGLTERVSDGMLTIRTITFSLIDLK